MERWAAIQNKQIGKLAGIKIGSDDDIPDKLDNEIGSDGKHPR